MTKKNPAEPRLDKIRILPPKISLFASGDMYDKNLKDKSGEHLRRPKPAGN